MSNYKSHLIVASFISIVLYIYYGFLDLKFVSKNVLLDFPAFYIAGNNAITGNSPYSIENIKMVSKDIDIPYTEYRSFLYPPHSLLLFSVFSNLNIYFAQVVFTLIKEISLLISIFLISIINFKSMKTDKNILDSPIFHLSLITGIFFSLFYWPVKNDILNGQVNIFVFLFIVLSYFFSEDKPLLSGFFLSLGILLKLTPLLIIPYFILRNYIKVVLYTLLFSIILTLISIYIYGYQIHIEYVDKLFYNSDGKHIPLLGWPFSITHNQSINGFFHRVFIIKYEDIYFGSDPIVLNYKLGHILIILFDIMFALIVAVKCIPSSMKKALNKLGINVLVYSKDKNDLIFGMYLSVILLISPVSWVHHMVILLFPNIILIKYFIVYKFNQKMLIRFLFF